MPQPDAACAAAAGRFARVEISTALQAAEAAWQALESDDGLFTPYQRYGLLAAWYRHVGSHDGARACIVTAFDANNLPLMVMPLAVETKAGIRVASFFGGKHVSLNMPLWRRDTMASVTPNDLDCVLDKLRRHNVADLLALTRQPLEWSDAGTMRANPMALWPHQQSINACPRLLLDHNAALDAGVSSSMRKRLRKKEGKLKDLPGYRYTHATNAVDAQRILDAFFAIKPLRMSAAGLPDVFSSDDVKAFLRAACLDKIGHGPAIEIHALECDDEVIAMSSAHYSPGLILLRNMIDHYVAQGHRAIDFGIGDEDYKRMFGKDDEPLFDAFIALNGRGRIAASVKSAVTRAKRAVKANPALKRAAIAIRSHLPL